MQMQFSICNNMQNNMQTLNPICKILTSLNFAYFAYICTAQFADGESPAYGQVEPTGYWQKNAGRVDKMTVRLLYTVVPVQAAIESRSCLSEADRHNDW